MYIYYGVSIEFFLILLIIINTRQKEGNDMNQNNAHDNQQRSTINGQSYEENQYNNGHHSGARYESSNSGAQYNSNSGAQYGNSNNGAYNNSNVRDFPPRTQYPRKKSAATVIVAIVLILMGTSHIVDTFVPWLFNWIDSGLVFSCLAIFVGFYLLVKKP